MSWSVSAMGSVEGICAELDSECEKQSGQCRIEFEAAKPHLQALLRENFAKYEHRQPILKFSASGSGSVNHATGEQIARSCAVSIEPIWSKLV